MSKPEGIPQDVWAGAENTLDTMLSNHGYEGWRADSIETIARAILAAKAEAYTDAADLAQRMGAGRKAQCDQAKTARQPKVARDFESMAMSAFDVAEAIRKRGEA